jgi:uncharacterized protein YxjI
MASASSSATSAPNFVVPNITSLVTIKLEGPNYMSWTSQFVPALSTHDLLGIVEGSDICPSKFTVDAEGKSTSTINPDFLVWQKKDQFVLAWLNATLSEKVLSMVYGLTTAQQVWAHLAKRFTPTSEPGSLISEGSCKPSVKAPRIAPIISLQLRTLLITLQQLAKVWMMKILSHMS